MVRVNINSLLKYKQTNKIDTKLQYEVEYNRRLEYSKNICMVVWISLEETEKTRDGAPDVVPFSRRRRAKSLQLGINIIKLLNYKN